MLPYPHSLSLSLGHLHLTPQSSSKHRHGSFARNTFLIDNSNNLSTPRLALPSLGHCQSDHTIERTQQTPTAKGLVSFIQFLQPCERGNYEAGPKPSTCMRRSSYLRRSSTTNSTSVHCCSNTNHGASVAKYFRRATRRM